MHYSNNYRTSLTNTQNQKVTLHSNSLVKNFDHITGYNIPPPPRAGPSLRTKHSESSKNTRTAADDMKAYLDIFNVDGVGGEVSSLDESASDSFFSI